MKILFVGDIVFQDKYELVFDDEFSKFISKCDYACCNIEGPLECQMAQKADKRGPNLANSAILPTILKKCGFNIVTLANNHIMDYGVLGLTNTISEFQRNGFLTFGAGVEKNNIYRYLRLEGKNKIGIISVAEKQFGASIGDSPGFAWMLDRKAFLELKRAKEECDLTIVLCHCGVEGISIPLPEVRELYRYYIDCGADLVIGNHTHIIQGTEMYKGKEIYYNLGNFIWDYGSTNQEHNSIGIAVDVDDNCIMRCSVIGYRYHKGKVEVCNQTNSFEKASKELVNEEEYLKKINRYCLNYYSKWLKRYYGLIIGFDIDDLEKQRIFCEHRKVGDALKWDDLYVYHNISIESNRWIAERAISQVISMI